MKNTDRVILYAASPSHAKQAALVLHSVLGLSLGETIRRAKVGEPLVPISIWGNEHDASAAQLRAILHAAPDAFVFEVITQSGDGAETAFEREPSERILGLLEAHEEHAAILEAYDARREAARDSK